ncbi:MAG: hypothetical protein EOO88_24890 [Pedobacter sp.]|nr:MAG: hypothetical protein EOO88_24890 [Pedobacter sp.]
MLHFAMPVWNVISGATKNEEALMFRREVRLRRLNANEFLVIEPGEYLDILEGGDYILIQRHYIDLFKDSINYVAISEVVIFDRLNDFKNHDFVELHVSGKTELSDIPKLKSDGREIWIASSSLFVSDQLKRELQDRSTSDLLFGEGLEYWGARS